MERRVRRPNRPSPSGRGVLASLALAVVASLAVAMAVHAEDTGKKQYSYEENPVRLGLAALKEGKFLDAKAHLEEAVANDVDLPHAHYGLGEVAVRQGNDAVADSLFQLAISREKDAFPEAHAARALVQMRLGHDDVAATELAQALKEDKNRWDVQYAKALLAIRQGRFDEAKESLREGKSKHGIEDGEDRYHYGVARLALAQGDLATADKEANLAMTVDPSNAEYIGFLADVYSQRGEPGLAIQKYEQFSATPGAAPTAAFYHHLGELYEKVNQPNDAIRRYTDAVKVDSTYAPALHDMGRLYSAAKVYDKAFLALSRYVPLAPGDVDAQVSYVRAALELKKYKVAHEAAAKAFEKDSTRTDVRLLFARSAAQDKDAVRATQLYSSLPDTSVLEPVDHVRLAQMAFESQRWGDAEAHLKTATTRDSTTVEGFFLLGLTEMRLNRPEDAVTALRRATVIAPNSAPVALNLGVALLQAKQTPEGIAALRQALAIAPDNPQVILTLGQSLATADSTDAAIAQYRRAIEINDSDAKAQRGLGLCQIQKKSYGEAVNALKQATALDGGNADGWGMLGQAYLGLNDLVHARQAAERCLQINPSHPTGRSVLDVTTKNSRGAGSAQ